MTNQIFALLVVLALTLAATIYIEGKLRSTSPRRSEARAPVIRSIRSVAGWGVTLGFASTTFFSGLLEGRLYWNVATMVGAGVLGLSCFVLFLTRQRPH